jgi:hypothetical protein
MPANVGMTVNTVNYYPVDWVPLYLKTTCQLNFAGAMSSPSSCMQEFRVQTYWWATL